jgi:acetyl-CoA carboxylase beta subunit
MHRNQMMANLKADNRAAYARHVEEEKQLRCPDCGGKGGTGVPSKGTWKTCPNCQSSGYRPELGVAVLITVGRAQFWSVTPATREQALAKLAATR